MSDIVCIRRANSTWTRCTCPPCKVDQARRDKQRKAGYYRRAPWEQAWDVLTERIAAGWSPAAIADAYGIPIRLVQESGARHAHGEGPRRFGNRTSLKLLKPAKRPTRGFVPAIGSTRRLQALGVLGWTLDEVRTHTGITASVLADAQSGKRTVIAAKAAGLIADVYEPMSARRGPSTRATFRALKKGWVPPLAWDEGSLDDPDARPHGGDNSRGRTPTRKIADLHAQGKDAGEIAVLLNMPTERVERAIERMESEAA